MKIKINSLAIRASLFLMLVIVSAQLLAGLIWYQHTSERDKAGLITTVNSLALSASSTISFFSTLPSEYRHLILNQLRNIGGTRFFVSLNNHPIHVKPLPDSQRKSLVINEVKSILTSELQDITSILVEFTYRNNLKVFNNELPIDELPMLWAHYSLSMGDLNPPILVIQIEVDENEWFYLAAVLPAPYIYLDTPYFNLQEWSTLSLSALLLLICTWLIIRKEVRPIRQLAKAATLMSSRLKVPYVKEEGSIELKAAIRAFNKMNQRINCHIKERDMLFSAISHDLKTPIACLKLRADMLNNEDDKIRFTKIANDLDLMVKGALQCIRETDIHEEIESIDLIKLLEHISSGLDPHHNRITINSIPNVFISGKPLAIKRALQNLIDNALKYGFKAKINIQSDDETIIISIQDEGSDLIEEQVSKLCSPYYRTHHHIEGNGLGLTISNSIIKAHGGTLSLSLNEQHGLVVTILFLREVA